MYVPKELKLSTAVKTSLSGQNLKIVQSVQILQKIRIGQIRDKYKLLLTVQLCLPGSWYIIWLKRNQGFTLPSLSIRQYTIRTWDVIVK